MYSEVRVALTVSSLLVHKAGVHRTLTRLGIRFDLPEGQRPERLGQEGVGLSADRDLTCPCPEGRPFDSDPVSKIDQIQLFKALVADHVLFEIDLHTSVPVFDVGEGTLSMPPPSDDSAPDRRPRSIPILRECLGFLSGLELSDERSGCMGWGRIVRERLDVLLTQRVELLPANAEYLA